MVTLLLLVACGEGIVKPKKEQVVIQQDIIFVGNVNLCRGDLNPPYKLYFLFDEGTICEREDTIWTDTNGFYYHTEQVNCQRIMRYTIKAGERSKVVGSVCSGLIHTDFGIEYYLNSYKGE
jgi:hypothetical protein